MAPRNSTPPPLSWVPKIGTRYEGWVAGIFFFRGPLSACPVTTDYTCCGDELVCARTNFNIIIINNSTEPSSPPNS